MIDQAWFCEQVALTNKLEFLKWAREVKQCEWDEWTINAAADKGNLEMLKYCFSNECPCDEEMSHIQAAINGHLDCLRLLFDKVEPSRKTEKDAAAHTGNLEMLKYCISNHCPCDEEASCKHAAIEGHLDCLRFLFDKVEPSRKTEVEAAGQATGAGHVEILKYIVEERKISDLAKFACAGNAAWNGQLDCLKYLVEEAKVPLDNTRYVSFARYKEHHDCLNYVREKGCPELTDEEYAKFAISQRVKEYIGHH